MGRKSPPHMVDQLKLDQTIDETNAHADKSDNHKAKNQAIGCNRANIGINPTDSSRDKRSDVSHQGRQCVSSRSALKNHTFLKKIKTFYFHRQCHTYVQTSERLQRGKRILQNSREVQPLENQG